jgi:hypothetical protein
MLGSLSIYLWPTIAREPLYRASRGTLRRVGAMKCSAEVRIRVVVCSRIGRADGAGKLQHSGTSTVIFCRTSNTHAFLCRQFRQRGVLADPRLSWLSAALDIQVTASHSTSCLLISRYFSKSQRSSPGFASQLSLQGCSAQQGPQPGSCLCTSRLLEIE